VLEGIRLTDKSAGFLIENMRQLWEVAKLMAASDAAVPSRFRGRPFLCFAVAQQATRWKADPWAVCNKAYVTKNKHGEEHIAYEAQLINAVINTQAPIEGRLQFKWTGEGADLVCHVFGKLRGDRGDKGLEMSLRDIEIRNSPLWKSAPQIQLGYWVSRAWARLYCPETILGIYAPEEIEAGLIDVASTADAPARPTIEQFQQPAISPPKEQPMAPVATTSEAREPVPQPEAGKTGNGSKTGEPQASLSFKAADAPQQKPDLFCLYDAVGELQESIDDPQEYANKVVAAMNGAFTQQGIDTIKENNAGDLGRLSEVQQKQVADAYLARRVKLPER
jgi:hypothetical protein